jgi:penicillin-binding protein 1A
MGNLLKSIALGILLFSFTVFLVIFLALWYFSSDLPNYRFLENYKPPVSTKVYNNNGEISADFAIQKRTFISINTIPPFVINAFLSAEDKNFFEHAGIDARGIIRAIFKNIKNVATGQRLEGASTITQQVAKNFLLTSEVSFSRKIKEAILAFRIEKYLSKNRILELYLNEIFLGERSYGIASASMTYFDKSLKELSVSEAALLATLPKAPSLYNPYRSLSAAIKRKDWVLERMFENNFLNKNEYALAVKEEIVLKKRKLDFYKESLFFTEEVRRFLFDKYGEDTLYKRGLYVKTSLDNELQRIATNALRKNLELYDKRHGWRGPVKNIKNTEEWKLNLNTIKFDEINNWKLALVKNVSSNYAEIETSENNKTVKLQLEDLKWARKFINSDTLGPIISDVNQVLQINDLIWVEQSEDNKKWYLRQIPDVNGSVVILNPWNGRIYSMVGGYSFDLSQFNRSSQAMRQPGSALKPFVYASALDNGYQPNTILLDAPYVNEQPKELGKWKPDNYGNKFYGKKTLRSGVEQSRNLMTVRLAEAIGNEKILDLTKKTKIYQNPQNLLSFTLGAGETTLLNLSSAYSVFANGGKTIEPSLVDLIQDQNGKIIYQKKNNQCEGCNEISQELGNYPKIISTEKAVLTEATAYQMVSILEGVIDRGTGKQMNNIKIPLAGKTGTTNNNLDAWFIGFTPDLVIGVYVGFDEPRTLGKSETGAKAALPIFQDIVQNLPKKGMSSFFKIPPSINLVNVNIADGLSSKTSNINVILESFKINEFPQDKYIDLEKKLSTVY